MFYELRKLILLEVGYHVVNHHGCSRKRFALIAKTNGITWLQIAITRRIVIMTPKDTIVANLMQEIARF